MEQLSPAAVTVLTGIHRHGSVVDACFGIVTSDVSSRKTVLDSYEQPAAAASDPQLVVNSPQLAADARMNSRAKMAGREQRGEGEARRQAPALQGGNAKEKCRNQPPFIRNCAHVSTVKYEQLCRERTRERTKVRRSGCPKGTGPARRISVPRGTAQVLHKKQRFQ